MRLFVFGQAVTTKNAEEFVENLLQEKADTFEVSPSIIRELTYNIGMIREAFPEAFLHWKDNGLRDRLYYYEVEIEISYRSLQMVEEKEIHFSDKEYHKVFNALRDKIVRDEARVEFLKDEALKI